MSFNHMQIKRPPIPRALSLLGRGRAQLGEITAAGRISSDEHRRSCLSQHLKCWQAGVGRAAISSLIFSTPSARCCRRYRSR